MENTVESLLANLKKTSSSLRVFSLVISFLTILNISLLFTSDFYFGYAKVISIISLIAVFVLLTIFDITRRSGDTYYEVLCTELNWRVKTEEEIRLAKEQTEKTGSEKNTGIPDIIARTTIRNFLQSKNLPIFPGSLGLPIFGFVNFFVALFVVSFILK